MHICRNLLHCTVQKNKIDLNGSQGRKSLAPFVMGGLRGDANTKEPALHTVSAVYNGKDWQFMYK